MVCQHSAGVGGSSPGDCNAWGQGPCHSATSMTKLQIIQVTNLININQQALEEARRDKAALEARAAEHAAATGRKDFAASLGMMQACSWPLDTCLLNTGHQQTISTSMSCCGAQAFA
jgi:hypothetical protein